MAVTPRVIRPFYQKTGQEAERQEGGLTGKYQDWGSGGGRGSACMWAPGPAKLGPDTGGQ